MYFRNDLTGQRFGRLTVVRDSGLRNRSGNIRWLCLCDCGKVMNVVGARLICKVRGTKSCGCTRKDRRPHAIKNLLGKQFGFLTVIKSTNERNKRHGGSVVWLCLCDCGKLKKVDSVSLREGWTKSCGHLIAKKYASQKQGNRARSIRRARNLTDNYIKQLLCCHTPIGEFGDVPANLYRSKRLQIQLFREIRGLKKEIKNGTT